MQCFPETNKQMKKGHTNGGYYPGQGEDKGVSYGPEWLQERSGKKSMPYKKKLKENNLAE